MSATWLMVLAIGAGTILIKGAGPLLLGGRSLAPRLGRMVVLFGPALLAALVVTNTFGLGRSLTVDARAAGLLAAVVALWLRAPVLVVVLVAAATAALVRALG